MKKLLLALLIVSGIVYADECADKAQKIVNKMHEHSKTAVVFDYSSDKAAFAKMCQADVKALDKSITVTMNQVSGSDIFKPHKPK